MIFNNKTMILSLTLILFQQSLLAASTYFIALAGMYVAKQEFLNVINYISSFFALALSAYLVSSIVSYNENNIKNRLWKDYIKKVFKSLNKTGFHSDKNKQQTVQWINGEAHSTLHDTVEFILDTLSTYTNVILTLVVYYLTIGIAASSVISASLILSTLMVTLLKKKITKVAEQIQSKKLNTFMAVPVMWDKHFFANKSLKQKIESDCESKFNSYFSETKKYLLLEQLIACTPVAITVPFIIIYLNFWLPIDYATIGSLVAVLPRTLQLLANVHSLSISNSKAIFIRSKYRNLTSYLNNLREHDFDKSINHESIRITNTENGRGYEPIGFLNALKSKELQYGRYVIQGKNGSGKSSMLLKIKSEIKNSIYLTVNSNLFEMNHDGSSGQKQIYKIKEILKEDSSVLLLDEWNSNLDDNNTNVLSELLNIAAKSRLLIEVRHH